MPILQIYLVLLFLAPQLWLKPFVGLPVDYFLYPFWILFIFFSGAANELKKNSLIKYYIFWLIWIVLAAIANNSLAVRYREFGNMVFYYNKIFLLFFLVSCSIKSFSQVKIIIFSITFWAVVLAAEGIQHKITDIGWAGQTLGWIAPEALAAGETGRTRWVGIFDGPGVFAVVYTNALPFLLIGLQRSFHFSIRLLSFVSLPLVLVAIYFNGSRGGLLASIAIFLMHFGVRLKVSKFKLFAAILVTFLFYMALPSHMTNLNDSSKSTYHRIEMWSEGVEMLFQNPFFGIGRGNFKGYTNNLDPHNSAIVIMGETGFIGLFAWAALLYMAVKSALSYIKYADTDKDKTIVLAMVISLMGHLVSSMFVTLEYETFYLLLAICGTIGACSPEKTEFTQKDFSIVFTLLVFFIALVFTFQKWYFMVH